MRRSGTEFLQLSERSCVGLVFKWNPKPICMKWVHLCMNWSWFVDRLFWLGFTRNKIWPVTLMVPSWRLGWEHTSHCGGLEIGHLANQGDSGQAGLARRRKLFGEQSNKPHWQNVCCILFWKEGRGTPCIEYTISRHACQSCSACCWLLKRVLQKGPFLPMSCLRCAVLQKVLVKIVVSCWK